MNLSRKFSLLIKHLLDFVFSIILMVLLLPLLLLISFSIIIDSGRPVFYRQERIGKNGSVFRIIKFRTMIVDADKIGDGLFVKSDKDIRITKTGRLLRTLSLDELPQLWNVFVGQMSFVGPRPPVTYHPYEGYSNYPEQFQKRFSMRPGITGLAQVKYRNSASWNKRLIVDVKYVNDFSLLKDLKIIYYTFLRIVKPENMYLNSRGD